MTNVRLKTGLHRLESPSDADLVLEPNLATRTGAVQIVGGARVSNIGGQTRFSGTGIIAEIYKNISEVVFLEGRHIIMEKSADAIVAGGTSRHETPFVLFPKVYIQNVRVEGVRGTYDALHADVFQMDLSAHSINIDKLTADTNYQVLFMRPEPYGGRILSHIDLRRCNFRKNAIPGETGPTKLIYFGTSDAEVAAVNYKIYLTDVWAEIPAGQDPHDVIFPKHGATIGSDAISPYVWWPELGGIIQDLDGNPGRVRLGAPPGGDFVPAGSVGLNYVSPGYQDG